ncbi:MAG: SusD/RagB family nutrient-binding outer membrane lipoprotein, partial [Bacteroidota bacterium]
SQYFATTADNFDSDRNVEVGRWIDLAWGSFYGQAAPQIKLVEDVSAEQGLEVENAIAKIWRVQAYHRQTDYWGPIIYSQFGNGETSVGYDSQESIYNNFFTTLDEAITVLNANTGASPFGSNDQIYGGDVNQWIKFANTLRLRLAIRIKYVDPAKAKTEAEKAVAGGVMTDNADNAFILTTFDSKNPYTTITNWGEFRMSALMESVLKGYGDPRIESYFNPAEEGDSDGDGIPYEGLRNGQLKVDKVPALNTQNSDMNTYWLPEGKGGVNPPIKVITASEAFFLRAEGALEGWSMGGSAQGLYEDGIRTSMGEYDHTPDADVEAYINSGNIPAAPNAGSTPTTNIPVAFESGANAERQLEQIITQKWIALYPDGWEAYAEVRRTGYPKLFPVLASDNPDVPIGQQMRRMTFVDQEFTNNAKAVEEAARLLSGPDQNNTKVWWDKK